MVTCADTAVNPGAVMIVALNASLAHIAVVAPWQGYYLALEAEFVDWEPL